MNAHSGNDRLCLRFFCLENFLSVKNIYSVILFPCRHINYSFKEKKSSCNFLYWLTVDILFQKEKVSLEFYWLNSWRVKHPPLLSDHIHWTTHLSTHGNAIHTLRLYLTIPLTPDTNRIMEIRHNGPHLELGLYSTSPAVSNNQIL